MVRMAHSQFRIPLKLNELSTCNISRRSKEAHLINAAKLFIWDETLMLHKFAFEAVDRTFRDITCVDKPFGRKVFVFGGDFQQVLLKMLNGPTRSYSVLRDRSLGLDRTDRGPRSQRPIK